MNYKRIKRIVDAAGTNYQPKSKEELQSLLTQLIAERGNEGDFNDIDTSAISDMSGLFYDIDRDLRDRFNGKIDKWNVSHVTTMKEMFRGCYSFNQPLNNWDVSSVTSMEGMFYGCRYFNQPLNNWDVSSVTSMSEMFAKCDDFNQPLNNWNVSSVKNMEYTFFNCNNFNQPLNNWDVSSVTSMEGTFFMSFKFNQPLNNWNVSSVKNMEGMFADCFNFNQPLNNWNVSSVKNMKFMFEECYRFTQSLDSWKVGSSCDTKDMFKGCKASEFKKPSWYKSKSKSTPKWVTNFLKASKGMPYGVEKSDYNSETNEIKVFVSGTYYDYLPKNANEWVKKAHDADVAAESHRENRWNPSWDVAQEALESVCKELNLVGYDEPADGSPDEDIYLVGPER